ncbi:cobyric acid synthase [Clostridiales bacterium]|nr:cobyric acid synthase [Clostridiales bacterium]
MAKALMIQGTMSNVGKSLMTAALCRIFSQDGYKVSPFKSQNMALNSYITADGMEIGRAQAMQAEASGIEPDICMNPILLKPIDDIGSQVILMGKPIGNMSAQEYYKKKREFIPHIMEAYDRLCQSNDIVVLEGAGSPTEINLRDNDIVNMGMAKLAKAPVILVGDIDRGGVFAQLLGTIKLLEKNEEILLKGMIINKFRGDRDILKPGLDMLENMCQKPIFGVVPYISCDIDDEDSLSKRFSKTGKTGLIDVAVVRLNRISNFTDFAALECIEGISVRYVSEADSLQKPDIIIIPGTKSTVADMLELRKNGMEARIKQLAAEGKIVFGICGGFQMLGEKIVDNVEAEAVGEFEGMGLIPIKTVFEQDKITTRTDGVINSLDGSLKGLSGKPFEGYEIHMGRGGTGEVITKGIKNVYGTYIHGIFDSKEVTDALINSILSEKGQNTGIIKAVDIRAYKESQYELLADTVRKSVDMDRIYDILDKGV